MLIRNVFVRKLTAAHVCRRVYLIEYSLCVCNTGEESLNLARLIAKILKLKHATRYSNVHVKTNKQALDSPFEPKAILVWLDFL